MHFFRVDSVDVSLASILRDRLTIFLCKWFSIEKGDDNKENLLALNIFTYRKNLKKSSMKENWKKAKKITNVGNNSFVELMKCRKSLFSIFNILKPIDCCQIRIYSGAATLHSPLCIFCMLNYTRGAHHNCKQGERTRYIIQTAVLVPTSSSVQSCEKIRIRFKSYAVVFLYTLLYTAF